MKKEIKGRRKPTNQIQNKNPFNKMQIKKRIPEKKVNVNNNKNNTTNIKKRVKAKPTKQDIRMRLIATGILLVAIAIVYFILGVEFAAIAAIGSALIVGFGVLIRKFKTTKRRRRFVNALIVLFLTLGIIAVIAFGAFFLYKEYC